MSASEGVRIAGMTVATLQSMRSDSKYDAFWDLVIAAHEDVDVDDPTLPRRRKVPIRFHEGSAPAEFPQNCKAYYRQAFFEALDLVINAIKDRFDQPDYRTYSQLEELLLKTIHGEPKKDFFDSVCEFYKDDLDGAKLQVQLETLRATFPKAQLASVSVRDVHTFCCSLSVNERLLLSEVVTVLKLILVLPSTNAVSERSFSGMRRLKTYLRTTMSQSRLNHLLLLHVHKDRTDSLSIIDIAKDFISDSEHRHRVFGHY